MEGLTSDPWWTLGVCLTLVVPCLLNPLFPDSWACTLAR